MPDSAPPAKKAAPARRSGKTAAQEDAVAAREERTPDDIWEALAAPFPEDWVEKLPKPLSRDDRDRSRCQEGSRVSADGHYCGGYHSRAVHLDYVGHAGITMRLNDVLGPGGWDFRPMATTPEGLPIISRDAFWAKLTITVGDVSVTKWELAANFNGPQEALGDALRRCAMRFGVGTYLWSKSEHSFHLAKNQDDQEPPAPQENQAPPPEPVEVQQVRAILASATEEEKANLSAWWNQAADQGAMPPLANWTAITPYQVGMVKTALEQIRDTLTAPSQEPQEGESVPDPQ